MAHRQWSLGREALATKWCRELFDGFISWAHGRVLDQKLALNVADIRDRFIEIELAFESREAITPEGLLNTFGAEGVRRLGRLMPYLHSRGIPVPGRTSSLRAAEAARISKSIEDMEESPYFRLFVEYATHLECPETSGRVLKPRTRRLYLTAAKGMLEAAGVDPIDQSAVEKMMRCTPGHAASLGRFISFLNQRYGHNLSKPLVKRQRNSNRSSKSRGSALKQLLTALDNNPSKASRKSLTASLLVGVSAVSLESILLLRRGHFDIVDQSVRAKLEDAWGTLPTPCSTHLREYLTSALPDKNENDLAFPGRPDYQPLSASSVYHQLRKIDISLSDLKRDAGEVIYQVASRFR